MIALDQYVDDVLSGRIVAGKLIRLACERHRDDLLDDRYVWREDMAQKACKFFFGLRHYKGDFVGKPFELEPWQVFIIGSVFGWYLRSGKRRYRDAYIEIARKNGKTFLAAGVALYLLLKDDEAAAEIYSVATKEDQARLVWRDTKFIIEKSPHLRALTKVKLNIIEADGGKCFFRALGRDSKTQDGLNPHGAIGDEMHAWPDRKMYDVITSAFGARSQPLFMNITTAGLQRDCFCYDHRTHCVNVLEGRKSGYDDESMFAFIASLDDGDDPFDESNWIKSNPNLGVSLSLENLQKLANRAKLMPSEKYNFLTKSLNVWVDGASNWFDVERWDSCRRDIDWSEFVGKPCFGGVDLAKSTDFVAMALLFPVGNTFVVKPHVWIPESTLETQTKLRDRRTLDRICKWRDEGWVTATSGDYIDYDVIQWQIEEYAKKYRIIDIGFDPHNAGNLPQKLEEQGINVTLIRQGHAQLGGPTKDFEGLVLAQRILHDGNPVFRWMLTNVVLTEDMFGNVRPDKKKAHEKIDAVVAALMALNRAQAAAPVQEPGFAFL